MAPPLAAADRTRLACTLLAAVAGAVLANALFNLGAVWVGLDSRFTTFLLRPDDNFGDFFSMLACYPGAEWLRGLPGGGLHAILPSPAYWAHPTENGHALTVTVLHMTPLATLVSLGLARASEWIDPVALFLSLTGLLAAGWWTLVHRNSASTSEAIGWFALGLVNYAALLMFTRGNLYGGLTALLLIGAFLLGITRQKPLLAALLMAIASNFRPNALLLGVPLFAFYAGWARWRFSLASGAIGLALLLGSLAASHALYPAYNLASFREGLGSYYELYAISYWGMPYGSSLFGALKLVLGGYRPGLDGGALLVSLGVLGLGWLLHRFRRIDDPTFLFVAITAYTLGSTVLGDYHLLAFLAVPIAFATRGTSDPAARSIALFATIFVLAPKNYVFAGPASLQVLLNPLVLLGASAAILSSALATTAATLRPARAA